MRPLDVDVDVAADPDLTEVTNDLGCFLRSPDRAGHAATDLADGGKRLPVL